MYVIQNASCILTEQLSVVTCQDARLELKKNPQHSCMKKILTVSHSSPAAHLGIKEGDAHVIRNAGGSAKDALRSIVISQRLLGTHEIAVFHHTGCGMLIFSTNELRDIVKKADPGNSTTASQVDAIDFLEFTDVEDSVRSDVKFLQESPLVLKETSITGWVYEVETGKVCNRRVFKRM